MSSFVSFVVDYIVSLVEVEESGVESASESVYFYVCVLVLVCLGIR